MKWIATQDVGNFHGNEKKPIVLRLILQFTLIDLHVMTICDNFFPHKSIRSLFSQSEIAGVLGYVSILLVYFQFLCGFGLRKTFLFKRMQIIFEPNSSDKWKETVRERKIKTCRSIVWVCCFWQFVEIFQIIMVCIGKIPKAENERKRWRLCVRQKQEAKHETKPTKSINFPQDN